MSELVIVPADVQRGTGAVTDSGTAGVAIAAGDPIYKDATTKKMLKSRANALATANCDGIAINSAALGQPVHWCKEGELELGAVLEQGEAYVVSPTTAGKIRPYDDLADNDYVTILGVAKDTTILLVDLINSEVPQS